MTIHAHVTDDPSFRGIRLYITDNDQDGEPRRVLRPDGFGWQWEGLPDLGAHAVEIPPTLAMPDEGGRALGEALVRYYQGAEDTRALRRDYDDERKRVDRLLDTVSRIATGRESA